MRIKLKTSMKIAGRHCVAGDEAEVDSTLGVDLVETGDAEEIKNAAEEPVISTVAPSPSPVDVAVVVTCHQPYVEMLPRQLAAIDGQTVIPTRKILCLDNCDYPDADLSGWVVIAGEWGHACKARQAAVNAYAVDWYVFADADDEMDFRYIESATSVIATVDRRIAVVYADLDYDGKRYHAQKKHNFNLLKAENYISSCSAWRRTAIMEAGGWGGNDLYQDWHLAVRVCRLGYAAQKQYGAPIRAHQHDHPDRMSNWRDNLDVRNNRERYFEFKWDYQKYAILTLFAGRENVYGDWLDWIKNAELPENVGLWAVDNSRDEEFGERLRSDLLGLKRLSSVHVLSDDLEYVPGDKWEKHRHVCRLYNRVIPQIECDHLVTLEDDVRPPLDGLRKLVDQWNYKHRIGAIGGIYPSRHGATTAVGAYGPNYWCNLVKMEDTQKDELVPVEFLAGGFTLWNAGALKICLPFHYAYWNGWAFGGWDSNASRDLREMKFKLYLYGGVQCEHNT